MSDLTDRLRAVRHRTLHYDDDWVVCEAADLIDAYEDVLRRLVKWEDSAVEDSTLDPSIVNDARRLIHPKDVHEETVEEVVPLDLGPSGDLVTKTGRVLTDQEIEHLADEAEAGYDVEDLKKRPVRVRGDTPHPGVLP